MSAADNVNAYKTEGHRHSAELEQELPGVAVTFVAHLIPVDQGLMATNYSLTKAELTKDDVRSLLHDAYEGEPFVDVVDEPPHTSHVRGTNRARVYGTITGSRVLTMCAIDNLWKGAAGQAVQDLNLMLGPARDGGAGVTLLPLELGRAPRARQGAGAHRAARGLRERRLRRGHQARGARRGAAALRARAHGVRRALHQQRAGRRARWWCPRRPTWPALRAITVNSGNANVSDGERGMATARAQQAAAAEALDLEPAQVAIASTGVIGRELARDKLVAGIRHAAEAMAPNAAGVLRLDPHHRPRPQARLPGGRAALRRDRETGRPGEGRGHALAEVRHHALLRPDRRRARRRRPPTCSPA